MRAHIINTEIVGFGVWGLGFGVWGLASLFDSFSFLFKKQIQSEKSLTKGESHLKYNLFENILEKSNSQLV